MKSVYLIGAMQIYGEKSEEAKTWRNKVKEYFSKYCLDFECVSPTDYYEYGGDYRKSEREVMRFDLRKVRESDIMLVNLRDIRQSIGSSDEIFYAYMLGKSIIGFIEEDLTGDKLVDYVHEWKYEQIDRIETGEGALEKACNYIKNFLF
ncbi:MAG: nucleoside 2-deoxyribosyltransferase [Lachnospiraceae bacterium]|nr:nucleoside 2-deoxyribosyltransferase [Lachnospiraceae bacterium]